MKRTAIAVVGPRARDIGEQMAEHGTFAVTTVVPSFAQLLTDSRFPTRLVILEDGPDPDCTRARIAIAQSLGSRVVLVTDDPTAGAGEGADVVVRRTLSPETLAELAAAEAETLRRSRPAPRVRPLTPITPREREALTSWRRLGNIRLVAEELNVGYQTAATLLKRARTKVKAGVE